MTDAEFDREIAQRVGGETRTNRLRLSVPPQRRLCTQPYMSSDVMDTS